MTLPNDTIRMPPYTGNGVTTTFPYTFKVWDDDELIVYEDGEVITTGFTITGVGDDAGGNVVFTTAPANGVEIVLVATITLTQDTDLVNHTAFFQSRIEDGLDRVTRMVQVRGDDAARSLRLPISEEGTDLLTGLPPLEERLGRTLSFDGTTGQPVMVSTASTSVSVAMEPVVQAATTALARAAMGTWGDALVMATGSTTARDLATRHAEGVSVRDFGAVGDGSTDDAAAIAAADTYADAVRKPVLFPPGSYRVKSTITRKTQSAWVGLGKQSSNSSNNEVQIYATESDIGSGNPVIRCAADGVAGQSIIFSGLEFISDKSVDPANLSAMTSAGVVLVDISHIKNGLEFVGCAFKNAAAGVKQGNLSPYLDKVTFSKCHFNRLYRALEASPTAGLDLDNCFVYDCYDYIDSTTDVHLVSCAFNNSSLSNDTCQISAATILWCGGWSEGGNKIVNPSRWAHVLGVNFSESYASGNKYMAAPQNDSVMLEFHGCRIPTNTRMIDLGGRTANTITMRVFGCYNGVNFSDTADIKTALGNGLLYEGAGNTNSVEWNLRRGYRNAQNATYGIVAADSGKIIYHTSASAHTWTIPANASVPFPIGTEIVLINESGGGNVTLAITTDTLRWGASTGSRTLAANGSATLRKVADTTWRLTGDGIT